MAGKVKVVRLHMGDGWRAVPAHRVEGGLALYLRGTGPTWGILHINSGLVLCIAGTKGAGQRKMDALLGLSIDWTKDEDGVRRQARPFKATITALRRLL